MSSLPGGAACSKEAPPEAPPHPLSSAFPRESLSPCSSVISQVRSRHRECQEHSHCPRTQAASRVRYTGLLQAALAPSQGSSVPPCASHVLLIALLSICCENRGTSQRIWRAVRLFFAETSKTMDGAYGPARYCTPVKLYRLVGPTYINKHMQKHCMQMTVQEDIAFAKIVLNGHGLPAVLSHRAFLRHVPTV